MRRPRFLRQDQEARHPCREVSCVSTAGLAEESYGCLAHLSMSTHINYPKKVVPPTLSPTIGRRAPTKCHPCRKASLVSAARHATEYYGYSENLTMFIDKLSGKGAASPTLLPTVGCRAPTKCLVVGALRSTQGNSVGATTAFPGRLF